MMNIDLSALGFVVITGLVGLGIKLLLGRMDLLEKTLGRHGIKLLRIEIKLGIPDSGNGGHDDG